MSFSTSFFSHNSQPIWYIWLYNDIIRDFRVFETTYRNYPLSPYIYLIYLYYNFVFCTDVGMKTTTENVLLRRKYNTPICTYFVNRTWLMGIFLYPLFSSSNMHVVWKKICLAIYNNTSGNATSLNIIFIQLFFFSTKKKS